MDLNHQIESRKETRNQVSDHNWMEMHQKAKKKDSWYLKGLLERIIVCCLLFIILYICSFFHVTVADYTTDRVISEVKQSTWVEAVQDQWNAVFHSEDAKQ